MPTFRFDHSILAATLVVLLSGTSAPAAPRDELLRFVPEEAGFCLVVQDLRGQLRELAGSPFGQQWKKSVLGQGVTTSTEWKQLHDVEQHLKKHLGLGWAELRDDLLGDAFVFAFRPGPPGKPEQDQGLFLLRARDEKLLAELVRKLNQLQKANGELKDLEERQHRGVRYIRRVEPKESTFYLLRGKVLLFTHQEALMRLAIDRDQALARDTQPELSRRLIDLGLDSALVALVIQPRAFDAQLTPRGNADQAMQTLSRCWKALEGIGLGLHLKRDLELTLTVKARVEQLPAAARRFLAAGSRASALWANFPDNALFAAAGQVDLSALYGFASEFLPKAGRLTLEGELERTLGAVLGKNLVKEVLPAIGPDAGLCVTAPPAEAKEWAPRLLAAVRVARGEEDEPIDQSLFSTVETWAQLAVVGHNRLNPSQALRLRTTFIDRSRVRYLQGEGTFPAGVQPAFGLRQGYLVLASSLAEFRRFTGTGPAPSSTAVPLLRMSFKAWRAYLKDRREELARALAAKEKLTKEKACEKIDGLRHSLELLDRLELRQQAGSDRVTITLAVQTTQPLKKER
jgi:hypothetical protein